MNFDEVQPGDRFGVSFVPSWDATFADPAAFSYTGSALFTGSIDTDLTPLVDWTLTYDQLGNTSVHINFAPSLGIDGGAFQQTVRDGIAFSSGTYTYSGPPIQFTWTVPASFAAGTVTFTDEIDTSVEAQHLP
jgi:hypothetical protein